MRPEEKGSRGKIAKSKSRNLLERLRDFESDVLRFMDEKIGPFSNNQAENDLQMTKVQQKISGCFRSTTGATVAYRFLILAIIYRLLSKKTLV
jgi:transposase